MLFSTKIDVTALAEQKQRQARKGNKTHNNFSHSALHKKGPRQQDGGLTLKNDIEQP